MNKQIARVRRERKRCTLGIHTTNISVGRFLIREAILKGKDRRLAPYYSSNMIER